jgi:tetratricopeptide (TPR) repeat protein
VPRRRSDGRGGWRLALGVAVVLLVLVTAGAIWQWRQYRAEARARQQEAGQKALLALERARALAEEGWQKQDLAKLKEARAEADHAVEMAAGADEDVRREAAELQQEAAGRLARAEKNRAFLAALLALRQEATNVARVDQKAYKAYVAAAMVDEKAYAAAFQRWGFAEDEAHLNLGNALLEQKRRAEAEKAFRRAIEFRPDFAEAHYGLGRALREQKKLEMAVRAFRRAVELRPDFAEARKALAEALGKRGGA